MQFESLSEFIAMDGHGLYVWLCYSVGLIVLAANLVSAQMSRKGLVKDLAQKQRREELMRQQHASTADNDAVEASN